MKGLTWQHVAVIALGVAMLIVGSLPFVSPAASTALIASGTGLFTGALGHAKGGSK